MDTAPLPAIIQEMPQPTFASAVRAQVMEFSIRWVGRTRCFPVEKR